MKDKAFVVRLDTESFVKEVEFIRQSSPHARTCTLAHSQTSLHACTYRQERASKRALFYDDTTNRDAKNLQERDKYAHDADMQARKKRNRYMTARTLNCALCLTHIRNKGSRTWLALLPSLPSASSSVQETLPLRTTSSAGCILHSQIAVASASTADKRWSKKEGIRSPGRPTACARS